MALRARVLHVIVGTLILLSNGACGHMDLSRLLGQEPPPGVVAEEAAQTDGNSGIQSARLDYSAERVQELEVIAQGSPSPRARAEAHYHLGWIFAYAENPNRDYDRALKEFEAYLDQADLEKLRADVASWVMVLKELKQYADARKEGHLDYSGARVQELEVIKEKSPSPRARADAHYFLGRIFAYEGNPKRDYDRALKEFETYLGLVEPEQVRADASSWVRVLKELKQQREEGGKQKTLNAQLEKRILEMEQDIQKLKDLDLWLENQKQDRR